MKTIASLVFSLVSAVSLAILKLRFEGTAAAALAEPIGSEVTP